MNEKTNVKKVIHELQQHKSGLCCEKVKRLLARLGFDVRDGKQGGHKVFVHQGLSSFHSGSFNCGHGRNPEIKPAYITKIIQILKQNQDELADYLTRTPR
jgi:nucleoside-triphosphatase THEP1